ncbi:MAG TPA: NTP transferase domain-containing protein [Solirubrobacteraceae bacterium]|nr:NTP transferase domain-containing protein [Solirubrobacteraceae bacterium]
MIGVVLAGGAGRRLGGPKAALVLDGRALLAYPLAALRGALGPGARLAVVAKQDTPLPVLQDGAERWIEPDEPRHPLCGLREALRRAGEQDLLVCPVDLPLLGAEELAALLAAACPQAPVAVASVDGRLQPLCGVWRQAAREVVERFPADGSLHELVGALGAQAIERPDPAPYLNVNRAEDLERAIAVLRAQPKVNE